jgi:hypothetical protein
MIQIMGQHTLLCLLRRGHVFLTIRVLEDCGPLSAKHNKCLVSGFLLRKEILLLLTLLCNAGSHSD